MWPGKIMDITVTMQARRRSESSLDRPEFAKSIYFWPGHAQIRSPCNYHRASFKYRNMVRMAVYQYRQLGNIDLWIISSCKLLAVNRVIAYVRYSSINTKESDDLFVIGYEASNWDLRVMSYELWDYELWYLYDTVHPATTVLFYFRSIRSSRRSSAWTGTISR